VNKQIGLGYFCVWEVNHRYAEWKVCTTLYKHKRLPTDAPTFDTKL